jgi:hypothetical protein
MIFKRFSIPYKVKFVILKRYTLRETAIKQDNLNCLKYFERCVTFFGEATPTRIRNYFQRAVHSKSKKDHIINKIYKFQPN